MALPKWHELERDVSFNYGSIKLEDPAGFGRYMALHWSSGDPVQPHEYVNLAFDPKHEKILEEMRGRMKKNWPTRVVGGEAPARKKGN